MKGFEVEEVSSEGNTITVKLKLWLDLGGVMPYHMVSRFDKHVPHTKRIEGVVQKVQSDLREIQDQQDWKKRRHLMMNNDDPLAGKPLTLEWKKGFGLDLGSPLLAKWLPAPKLALALPKSWSVMQMPKEIVWESPPAPPEPCPRKYTGSHDLSCSCGKCR